MSTCREGTLREAQRKAHLGSYSWHGARSRPVAVATNGACSMTSATGVDRSGSACTAATIASSRTASGSFPSRGITWVLQIKRGCQLMRIERKCLVPGSDRTDSMSSFAAPVTHIRTHCHRTRCNSWSPTSIKHFKFSKISGSLLKGTAEVLFMLSSALHPGQPYRSWLNR